MKNGLDGNDIMKGAEHSLAVFSDMADWSATMTNLYMILPTETQEAFKKGAHTLAASIANSMGVDTTLEGMEASVLLSLALCIEGGLPVEELPKMETV